MVTGIGEELPLHSLIGKIPKLNHKNRSIWALAIYRALKFVILGKIVKDQEFLNQNKKPREMLSQ